VPPAAALLAGTCWPGPLTLILRRRSGVLDVVTGGLANVGLRVPAHPLTTELLTRFGGGLAAPSANLFGRVSPTTAEHVEHDLGDLVDYVLDGGRCPVGVESTIVDCTVTPPQILRPGGIPAEQISALLDGRLASAAGPSRAPGMLAAHYAPRARVVLVDTSAEALALAYGQEGTWVLDRTDDLVDYARALYSDLRQADARGITTIVAVLPPPVGIGHAIRDRLAKAAAAH
jgi:L-threonylcarbamoyladenylate synthase